MQIMDRIRFAQLLHAIGVYHWRGAIASLIGGVGSLAVLASLTPEMLPHFAAAYQPWLVDIGRTAALVTLVAGAVLAQSDRVVPKLPDDMAKPEPPQ